MTDIFEETYIQKFLDFINSDIDSLSLGEKMKLAGDMVSVLVGTGGLQWELSDNGLRSAVADSADKSVEKAIVDWLQSDKLQKCHDRIENFFL